MRQLLYRFYWKLEKVFFPGLKSSQYHYYGALKEAVPEGSRWLDLGCGHQMFAYWMTEEEKELARRATLLIGIDLDLAGMKKHQSVTGRVFGNLEQLPFESGSFHVVTANMVAEHLSAPDAVLSEIHRVLRPGGVFVFHTPNARCAMMTISALLPQKLKNLFAHLMENRKEEDVFPTFYRLNTEQAIRERMAKAGFRLEGLRSVSTSAVSAMLGPFAIVELLYLRLIEAERFKGIRSNLIATLRKPG
jgi:ubiquinone/menaquinone biosynthesis C-methylase UbiE